jgi:hypothetical protein
MPIKYPSGRQGVGLAIAIASVVAAAIVIMVLLHNNSGLPEERTNYQRPPEHSRVIPGPRLTAAPRARPPQRAIDAFLGELAEIQTADGQRLLALYKAAIDHDATLEQKYIAMEITMACNGYVNPRTLTRQAAEAMSQLPVGAPQRAIMEDRLDGLANRCAQLDGIGREALHAETLRLSTALSALDSPFAPIQLTNPDGTRASAEQLAQARQQTREALDAYGPVALNWVRSSLIGLATSDQDQPDRIDFGGVGQPSPAAAVALAIAPCLAGQPCDSNTLSAMGMCVGSGGADCGDSVEASLLSQLPDDAARAHAKVLASQIVGAIAARDWTRLGL